MLDQFKTVIHLVGEQPVPVFLPAVQFSKGIRHLLLTTDSPKTAILPDRIGSMLENRGYQCEKQIIGEAGKASDFAFLNDAIGKCLDAAVKDNEPAAFNITGGTKPMALVAFTLARRHKNVRCFYFDFNKRQLIWLDDFSTVPVTERLKIDDFIKFSGLEVCRSDKSTPEMENLAVRAFHFSWILQKFQRNFADFMNEYEKGKRPVFKHVFEPFADNLKKHKGIDWLKDFDEVFKDDDMAKARFLSGGWFELKINSVVKKIPGILDVCCNLQVLWPDDQKNAQELDVAYTDGYSFFILECKAGSIKQEYFQKLENLRNHFSGALGTSAFVTLNAEYQIGKNTHFRDRVKSYNLCAFCGPVGIDQLLPEYALTMRSGKIYGSNWK